jgi:hypothetical protein
MIDFILKLGAFVLDRIPSRSESRKARSLKLLREAEARRALRKERRDRRK